MIDNMLDRSAFINLHKLDKIRGSLEELCFFISYDSENKDDVKKIVEYLQLFYSNSIFHFCETKPLIWEYADEIKYQISQSSCFIFFLSSRSLSKASPNYIKKAKRCDKVSWQIKELEYALNNNLKPVIFSLESLSTLQKLIDLNVPDYGSTTTNKLWRKISPATKGWLKLPFPTHKGNSSSTPLDYRAFAATFISHYGNISPQLSQNPKTVTLPEYVPSTEIYFRINTTGNGQAQSLDDWLDYNGPLRQDSAWKANADHGEMCLLSPILGAGSLQVDPNEALYLDSRLEPTRLELHCTGPSCGFKDGAKCPTIDSGKAKIFAGNLINGRLHGRSPNYSSTDPKPFSDLRLALLQLAMVANDALVDTMTRSYCPIDNWSTVPAELGEEDCTLLLCFTDKALAALDLVIKSHSSTPTTITLLAPSAIANFLNDMKQKFQGGKHALLQADAERCAEYFWHSMIFQAPHYPHPKELRFQALLIHQDSIKGKFVKTRRDEPQIIPASRDLRLLGDAVRACIARGVNPQAAGKNHDFFKALAEVLWHDWERVKHRDTTRYLHQSRLPLAITTTFDFEMESALASIISNPGKETNYSDSNRTFHVVLPVVEAVQGKGEGAWSWLMATLDAKTFHAWALDSNRSPQFSPSKWTRLVTCRTIEKACIQGPIVLRLNGTPFFSINPIDITAPQDPVGESWSEGERSMVPYLPLALSDYDVIQFLMMDMQGGLKVPSSDIVHGPGLPNWLFSQLACADRYWLALGVGMSTWNSRLSLFLHTVRAAGNSKRIVAMSRLIPPDRAAFLNACGITPVEANLDHLSQKVFSDYLNRSSQ